jgi:transposase InsO family protein
MRRMGITAIAPRRKLSKPAPGHKIYPYLLRGLPITEAGHVWSCDFTYLPMARGFCYLVAIMDWASRRVLPWRLSNTLDASFCIEALEEALERYDAPQIFNTDQGSQFTCEGFTSVLRARRCHQHGRPRSLARQRLHRATLAIREARGGLPESLREPRRGAPRARRLLRLLQPSPPISRSLRPYA